MKKTTFLILFSLGTFITSMAQDVTPEKDAATAKKPKYAKSTFQSSSIINLPSVEMSKKGNLQFMVAHHFGTIWSDDATTGSNFAQVFGLNSGIAHTYLSFDYSITDYANVGLGLTGNSKFEGWAKFKILRQQTGANNIPVTVTWLSLVNADAQYSAPPQKYVADGSEFPPLTEEYKIWDANRLGWNKFSYMHQLLIARKFSSKFSLQLMPTLVHYNIVPYGINNSNNIFSIGLGGKYQLSTNKALTFEYVRQLNMYDDVIDKGGNIINYSPDLLAIGLEFNTGGHVFQFYLGNTTAASNIEQLSRNTNKIGDGQFALGFRLNRSFFLGGK